jgi:hypothetical protein
MPDRIERLDHERIGQPALHLFAAGIGVPQREALQQAKAFSFRGSRPPIRTE